MGFCWKKDWSYLVSTNSNWADSSPESVTGLSYFPWPRDALDDVDNHTSLRPEASKLHDCFACGEAVCMHKCVCVCVCVCVCAYMYVHMCAYMQESLTRVCGCVCMCAYVHACVHVCMHTRVLEVMRKMLCEVLQCVYVIRRVRCALSCVYIWLILLFSAVCKRLTNTVWRYIKIHLPHFFRSTQTVVWDGNIPEKQAIEYHCLKKKKFKSFFYYQKIDIASRKKGNQPRGRVFTSV